jgi:hypothetical protein
VEIWPCSGIFGSIDVTTLGLYSGTLIECFFTPPDFFEILESLGVRDQVCVAAPDAALRKSLKHARM